MPELDAFATTLLEPFGVEIHADLSRPMSAAAEKAFAELFRTHHLVVARNQEISDDDRLRLTRAIGLGSAEKASLDPPISNTRPEGALQDRELSWHADNSYAPCPIEVIALYSVELAGPSFTRFADNVQAYQRLSPAMKGRLAGLTAVNVLSRKPDGRPDGGNPIVPSVTRPVIWDHPDFGLLVYVHYNTTDLIEGMSAEASEALLDEIFAEVYAEEHIYDHHWQLKDFVIWSNIAIQHCRGDTSHVGPRTFVRTSICEKTMVEMYAPDALAEFARYTNAAVWGCNGS